MNAEMTVAELEIVKRWLEAKVDSLNTRLEAELKLPRNQQRIDRAASKCTLAEAWLGQVKDEITYPIHN